MCCSGIYRGHRGNGAVNSRFTEWGACSTIGGEGRWERGVRVHITRLGTRGGVERSSRGSPIGGDR
jgi:hypothetical protein